MIVNYGFQTTTHFESVLIMSARNYLSAREKNTNKVIECLPNINQQKFNYRSGSELPPLSANTNHFVNRNLNYSYEVQPYLVNSLDRAGTPFSDFFSDSETGNQTKYSNKMIANYAARSQHILLFITWDTMHTDTCLLP